ncbi:ketopantoate reductase family protein [Aspergillus melleus]|uniref:ketopantoate reductase family protein n=1 Tax=Aspergillus melleus TaxID=138277 RepID=UPI001E8E55BD|nr:2-dehydropantoate 2-reductase (Ketopantoate reductase) (KPA reductase) (KPR) [Aspergillus melleus]KAH8424216.1 2-dehydropantoate 2-reductase (Ketopantoate reductase) (KPA reductase) (KPR) [Aspergillus melleus]
MHLSTIPTQRRLSSTSLGRVHILGLGSIGTFVAHSISEIPNGPSAVLLLHRKSLLDQYRQNGNQILFESRHGAHQSSTGYGLEMTQDNQWYPVSDESPTDCPVTSQISDLIVCVKATQTVSALRPLSHRLNSRSSILFLQNGSGMIEEVNTHLFQDPSTRPNYLIGVISHGVTLNNPFNITHTGFSATSIGPVPRDDVRYTADSRSNYLLQTLPKSPTLNLKSYPYTDILQVQLEKLAVNAFCNPLCALNDAKNEFLFSVPDTRRAILTEISNVVLSLPELKGVQGLDERFSVARLEKTVNDIITKTANTTCSMVWDVRAGRETEIQFINGCWSRMGRMVGVDTPVNDALVEQIKMRGRGNFKKSEQ